MSFRSFVYYSIAIVTIIAIVAGCGRSYPPDVAESLSAAGNNRAELEKVIDHYKASGDSLKLDAAYFLIGNMEGHCYATYRLVDSSGIVFYNMLFLKDMLGD